MAKKLQTSKPIKTDINIQKVAFLTFLGYSFFAFLTVLGVSMYMDYVSLLKDREVRELSTAMVSR